ncbi:MAG: RDD family protein [Polaribacter sp.]
MDNFQIETAQNINIHQNVAHITTRIGSFLIDLLIIISYYILLIFIMSWLNLNFGIQQWAISLILSLPMLFYTLIFETLWNGQTPGKRINKTRVVKLDGSKPTLGNYMLRWMMRIIDIQMATGSVAVLTILLNGKGQRLGDLAAGTTIISEKKRVTLQEVLLADAAEDYSPTFPQVTLLSDADAQTIKKLYHTALQKRKHAIIIKLHERIIEITGIKTELKPIDFLKVVLTDYDYYTQQ